MKGFVQVPHLPPPSLRLRWENGGVPRRVPQTSLLSACVAYLPFSALAVLGESKVKSPTLAKGGLAWATREFLQPVLFYNARIRN